MNYAFSQKKQNTKKKCRLTVPGYVGKRENGQMGWIKRLVLSNFTGQKKVKIKIKNIIFYKKSHKVKNMKKLQKMPKNGCLFTPQGR